MWMLWVVLMVRVGYIYVFVCDVFDYNVVMGVFVWVWEVVGVFYYGLLF